jgi:DNA-binding SARP family transcriptional activator
MELQFGLLGPLSVAIGQVPLPVSAAKQRVVLALLLLRGNHVVSTDELIDAIWDETPPATARVTLQNYIRRLRMAFGCVGGGRIRTVDPGYQIDLDSDELDVNRFDSLCRQAQDHTRVGDWERSYQVYQDALDLWRGEPLVDVPCRSLTLEAVPRLNEVRLQAKESWINAGLHFAQHSELIPQLRELAGEHPFRERVHRLLMLALYRDGRQAEALAAYRHARDVLLAELGTEPGPELQRLHQQVLGADPGLMLLAPAATVRSRGRQPRPQLSLWQLPRDLPDFTGRTREIDQLKTALADAGRAPSTPVCAILGAGGIGKSALAVHVGHLVSEQFPDGQMYADLGGYSGRPVAPVDVLARFLRDLGGDGISIPTDRQELAAHYRSRLRGRRVLIVLDEIVDADQIRDLLPGSPGCAVLTTSRERLLNLDSVQMTSLGPLDPHEAFDMFSRIVSRRRTEEELAAATELLEICGWVPLAIRIAAVQLVVHANWSVSRFTDKLTNLRQGLEELWISGKTLRSTCLHSYEQLPRDSVRSPLGPRRAFRLLSVFDGPEIGLEAAAALFNLPTSLVEGPLEYLADMHLLESCGSGRYRFNWLTRAFALQCAEAEDSPAQRDDALRRILSWYLMTSAAALNVLDAHHSHSSVLARHRSVVMGPFFKSRDALSRWLRTERRNLMAAVEQARRSDIDATLWQLPIVVRHLFGVFGEQLPDPVVGDFTGTAHADAGSAS